VSPLFADGIAIVLAVLAAWALPAAVMAALVPSLEAGRVVENYRGRPVFLGLGLTWMVWAVGLMAVRVFLEVTGTAFSGVPDSLFNLYAGPLGVVFSGMPVLLVAFAFAFGLVDDVFGTSGHKGFRGHLNALRERRMTSGALKLFGIGFVAMFYGWSASTRVADVTAGGSGDVPLRIGAWVLATLVIALSTNLFNLLDLRPGRAIKSYIGFAIPLGIAFAARVISGYADFAAGVGDVLGPTAQVGAGEWVAMILTSLVVLLGPVIAVWRYDLGERGMLGDAGSNVLGAIVGFLLVGVLPLWGFAVAAAILLALNLVSERVSFSAVIARVAPLRWLDSLGGLGEGDPGPGVAVTQEDVSPAETVGEATPARE
jgi:hypothetical protein